MALLYRAVSISIVQNEAKLKYVLIYLHGSVRMRNNM